MERKKDRRKKRRKVSERKEIRKEELESRKEGNGCCNDKKKKMKIYSMSKMKEIYEKKYERLKVKNFENYILQKLTVKE